ncbi:hypothetical protein [Streptomyces caniscabiei]|uniref:hypothetical protein n=1 Tax=Streptomyces caniscabiei TaxID=2746961 RepID=UPI0029B2B51C|nr:hypothetical protein [Streptomyces caniscabiei]MDX2948002.1 hypothetical protein [Streptomyces caniscabiei]MDX2986480.1 hypothetical protein [Streptomyces caniscabiei]
MTTVKGKLIGAPNPQRVEMQALLVDVTGKPAVGYVPTLDGEIVSTVHIQADDEGDWTASLTANTLVESTSGDTLWAVQEGRLKDGSPVITYVLVPESGSEWWVGDLRVDLADTQTGQGTVVYAPGPAGPQGPAGATGEAGADGTDGDDGDSAYDIAVAAGFTGSEAEWLASLVGPQGDTGPAGPQPPLGAAGAGADVALRSTDPSTTNARTPTAHAASHASGGTDPITPASIGAEPAGTAAAAVAAHAGATDPHGDRAWADNKFATATALGATNSAVTSLGGAVTDLDGFVQDCLTRVSAIENGTAWLSGLNVAGNAHVSNGDLTVADVEKGYRFRRGGDALDLEATGADLILSNWSGTGFNGTQRSYDRYSADALNVQHAGKREYVDGLYGTAVHTIDPATGVAALGAKNSQTNIRLVGRRATAGPPTTGVWAAGDTVQDSAGAWWLCTGAGEPGTWVTPAAPGSEWTPADQSLAAWSMDPASCTAAGTTLSAGFIYLVQLLLRAPATLTKVHAVLGAAGAGLTSGQCLAGYYDTAGNRVGITTDMSTTWNSAGNKAMNLTGSYAAPAGKLYAAFLFNGTTSPTFACGSTLGASFTPGNANLAAGAYRFCRSASGQTSLPSSVTLAGFTPDANNVWAAAS